MKKAINSGIFGIFSIAAISAGVVLHSCRHGEVSDPDRQGGIKSSVTGGSETDCRVETDSSIKGLYDAAQDPFKLKVLTASGCSTVLAKKDPYIIHSFMTAKAGCQFRNRFIVSEKGTEKVTTETGLDPRTIDEWQCGNAAAGPDENSEAINKVWISGPGSAMHIISWDPKSKSFNFYSADHTTDPNQIFFHGNSHVQAVSTKNTFRHPCTNCHIGGGLLIKELHFPWPFWHSDVMALPAVAGRKWTRASDSKQPVTAVEQFEIEAIASMAMANQSLVNKLAAGVQVGSPLPQNPVAPTKYKDLLYPLFCEKGIEVASSASLDSLSVPWPLMLNRLLVPKNGKISLTAGIDPSRKGATSRLDATGFADNEDFAGLPGTSASQISAFRTNGEWFKAASNFFVTPAGANPDRTRFRMIFPARHFADDDLISRLVNAAIIPEDFATNVLMVDLQNPVFSETRCGLLEKIPASATLPSQASEFAASGASLVSAFESAVNSDTNRTNPGSGAAKYLAMKAVADKGAFINGFAASCAKNLVDPVKAAKAMAIRWTGYKKPQPGIGSVFIGKDFNRGIEDFVEKEGMPKLKTGLKFVGITQGCDVK